MKGVSTNVEITVNVPRDQFFYWFMSIDPSKVFHKYLILPGIVESKNQTGPMHLSGSSRQLIFFDGTSVYEQIISSDPPKNLQYHVFNLTSMFRYLVREGSASFNFTENSSSVTHIKWRYTFFGHNWLAELILQSLIHTIWRGYMRQALEQAKTLSVSELSD